MGYNVVLAKRIRYYLNNLNGLVIVERRMFGGLAFLINDMICVNVSGDMLMCRFNPMYIDKLSRRMGFLTMIMRDKILQGYCYVEPIGFVSQKDFVFWIELCLEYNNGLMQSKK